MKHGSKIYLYLSREVLDDLAILSERFPGETEPALIRRALSALSAQTLEEARHKRVAREALRLARRCAFN
jgi:hypothetical protein